MPRYQCWTFPDKPTELAAHLFESDKKLVIVGVIGKSAHEDANKMIALDVLDCYPSTKDHKAKEGQLQFYYNPAESMLFIHFETSFDAECLHEIIRQQQDHNQDQDDYCFQDVRSRFARLLLFATQVCHILVFVELNVVFDASLVLILKSLKVVRDRHVLKFLPKQMRNWSTGSYFGKTGRMCSPRMLFLFENFPDGYDKSNEAISKLEFEMEDNIYKMLRNENIVCHNSSMSLFSIPGNKRFVFYNTNRRLREDLLLKSLNKLGGFLQNKPSGNPDGDLEDLAPFRGFGKPLSFCVNEPKTETDDQKFLKQRKFMKLLKEHVLEALQMGFNDNSNMYKTKNHFVILPVKTWYETFKMLHTIFVENPNNPSYETSDMDYRSYLENFDKIIDVDRHYFSTCFDAGLKKAFALYNNPAQIHYGNEMHQKLTEDALALYRTYARGPRASANEAKLREMCESCWKNGKQQCEVLSLRGHPCILAKHVVSDPAEHTSGNTFISSCNCGRTQGRREDPYTIRHANYEFYEYMANNCNLCAKVRKIRLPVFQPSINDYRPAEFDRSFESGLVVEDDGKVSMEGSVEGVVDQKGSRYNLEMTNASQPLTASQGSHTNLSLGSLDNLPKIKNSENNADEDEDDDDSVKELVIKVKDKLTLDEEEEKERTLCRQPSTTEYLPGMVHTESPVGLLPQFPSWSLACVGPSSVYSHNTGLMEHFQTGFMPGANYLLPWDVHVRLEHSAAWVAAYEKTRLRKMGEVFVLKLFVGCDYECPRGHRFMLCAPDKVLRGGSGILRDSGSKIVYNNMPLYFPCPCRTNKFSVAQLMRVHVVTPKAPVNVIIDPKVRLRSGDRYFDFTLGMAYPPKLTQSAYWMLRLPYVYQGDDGSIPPPTTNDLTAANAVNHGCLLAGMFGISETILEE